MEERPGAEPFWLSFRVMSNNAFFGTMRLHHNWLAIMK